MCSNAAEWGCQQQGETNPEERTMARYDPYRQAARQEKQRWERSQARQAIEDAYQAVLAAKAREEAYTLAGHGTPAEREAFRARLAAEAVLYKLDPEHRHFT
jgi:hypothetical protein